MFYDKEEKKKREERILEPQGFVVVFWVGPPRPMKTQRASCRWVLRVCQDYQSDDWTFGSTNVSQRAPQSVVAWRGD